MGKAWDMGSYLVRAGYHYDHYKWCDSYEEATAYAKEQVQRSGQRGVVLKVISETMAVTQTSGGDND